ncbi:MAG TPA: hypothetical protein VJX67_17195, partial [Blastocatellia bacterium]|nr:hypothetical protein [Blastocatellia bacterium]
MQMDAISLQLKRKSYIIPSDPNNAKKGAAMANGKIIRKNVDNLSDDELAAIRDAYSKMQQITDNRGYNYWAGLHGIPHFYCWHGPRTQQGG